MLKVTRSGSPRSRRSPRWPLRPNTKFAPVGSWRRRACRPGARACRSRRKAIVASTIRWSSLSPPSVFGGRRLAGRFQLTGETAPELCQSGIMPAAGALTAGLRRSHARHPGLEPPWCLAYSIRALGTLRGGEALTRSVSPGRAARRSLRPLKYAETAYSATRGDFRGLAVLTLS